MDGKKIASALFKGYSSITSHQKRTLFFFHSILGRKLYGLTHFELAQPINKLEDPHIKLPRPRPMALTIGTTAIFPVDDMEGQFSDTFIL